MIILKETENIGAKGTLRLIEDGEVIYEKQNAIHRHNLNQIISRALGGRDNSGIARMGFGSGGTIIDSTYDVYHRPPNVGNPPHDITGWASRMYNETYSKPIDHSNITIEEDDESSRIIIRVTLDRDEPQGQLDDDNISPTAFVRNDYTFDEISLFSAGLGPTSTRGYQLIELPDKTADDISGLETSMEYYILVDTGNGPEQVSFMTRPQGTAEGGRLTYRDIVTDFNNSIGNQLGIRLSVTDELNFIYNNGYMRIENLEVGSNSFIEVSNPPDSEERRRFLDSLIGLGNRQAPVHGTDAGVRNNKNNPELERERLLTHITFDPILKSINRILEIEYEIELI